MSSINSCESCMYYEYDEDYDCCQCAVNLDEDEMMGFLSNNFKSCPYFKFGDEYRIVKKQI